jgi:hypothetical protein
MTSLSTFLKPTSGQAGNYLTAIVADTNGNILGICKDDTAPNIYLSPSYPQITVEAMDGDNAPIDNQVTGSTVIVVPTLIAANSDLTAGLIATKGTGGKNNTEYAFLYRFTGSFGADGSAYTYIQMPFYTIGGDVLVGPVEGSATVFSKIFSIAVSPDGNMYASYTNDNDPTHPLYGILLQYDANGSYQTSGPSGAGGDGTGAGFFMKVSDVNLNHVNQIACATGNILYCSKFDTTGAANSSISKVSGTTVTDITDNLATGGLGAVYIIGLACSSDGSILYAIDSFTPYKYNPTATAGSRWSILSMTGITIGTLSEIKCDSTGTYIMLSDISANRVYFSDDAGTTWQTDTPPFVNPIRSPVSISSPSPYRQYISYSNNVISGSGVYERMSTTVNTGSADFLLSKTSPTQMLTNTDGSKILFINGTSKLYYSTTFGNSFTELSNSGMSTITFSKIAATSDFSKILVQMADNELSMVTLGTNSYTLTTPTYGSGITAVSTTVPSLISVSSDGNMAIVQDVTDLTDPQSPVYQYNLWYSIQGAPFLYLGPVDHDDLSISSISISNEQQPYITIITSSGTVDQYQYNGTPLGYSIKSMTPANYSRLTGGAGGAADYIVSSTTGQVIFINVTTPSAGPPGVFVSTDYGGSFNLIVPTSLLISGGISRLACNSTGTTLMIQMNTGIYFIENVNPSTQAIGQLKFITSNTISAIASNANGGRQYFFNSTTGLTSRNATAAATPCFLEGTKILCKLQNNEVYLSVQNIKVGTLVKTSSGFKKVYKIGNSCIRNPGHSGRTMDRIYVCKKSVFPELTEDLFVTGYHSILVDELTKDELDKTMKINGQVFEADNKKCLMAGVSTKTEPWAQEGTFTIWHLSLEDEHPDTKFGVYSNGLLTETCSMNYMDYDSIFNFCKRKTHIPTFTGTPTQHTFNKSRLLVKG